MEKMKKLYEKVAGDSALRAKFAEIMKDAETAGGETKEKLTAFAKEAGYDVSFEEVQEYFNALSGQKDGELSDTELDAVAGGKSEQGQIRVVYSVITLGLGCAVASYSKEDKEGQGACAEFFK